MMNLPIPTWKTDENLDDPENVSVGMIIEGCSFDSIGIHFRTINRQTS